MGLFDGKKKQEDALMAENEARARELLDRYNRKELNDAALLKELGKCVILYTTPIGDTKEGTKRFYLIPGPKPTAYMPVFLNEKEMQDFYEGAGRTAFLILKGTLPDLLKVCISENQKDDLNFKYGIMIDPVRYKLTLDAPVLETVRNMIIGG